VEVTSQDLPCPMLHLRETLLKPNLSAALREVFCGVSADAHQPIPLAPILRQQALL